MSLRTTQTEKVRNDKRSAGLRLPGAKSNGGTITVGENSHQQIVTVDLSTSDVVVTLENAATCVGVTFSMVVNDNDGHDLKLTSVSPVWVNGTVGTDGRTTATFTIPSKGYTYNVHCDGQRWVVEDVGTKSVATMVFGGPADGVTDITGDLKAALEAMPKDGGRLVIPAGTYILSEDVELFDKGGDETKGGGSGAIIIEAYGAVFKRPANPDYSTPIRFIIGSCKRVQIKGLDMKTIDLSLRGCWWSVFEGMRFRRLLVADGDSSTNGFLSCAWVSFCDCYFQQVVAGSFVSLDERALYNNAFKFRGCAMRGDVRHGFVGKDGTDGYEKAFDFSGAKGNYQNWHFIQGDVSEYWVNVYEGGNVAYKKFGVVVVKPDGDYDAHLTFSGVYFDSLPPLHIPGATRTTVTCDDCHGSSNTIRRAGGITMEAALSADTAIHGSHRAVVTSCHMNQNLIINGDLKDRNNPPIDVDVVNLSAQDGTLYRRAMHINSGSREMTDSAFIKRCETIPMPYAGRVTCRVILRQVAEIANEDFASMKGHITDLNDLLPEVDREPQMTLEEYDTAIANIVQFDIVNKGTGKTMSNMFVTGDNGPTEWMLATLTLKEYVSVGDVLGLTFYKRAIYGANGKIPMNYNIHVAYVGITLGEGGPIIAPPIEHPVYTVDVDFDFTGVGNSLGDGSSFERDDIAIPVDIQDGWVFIGHNYKSSHTITVESVESVLDVVKVILTNNTGDDIDNAFTVRLFFQV
jgi:hypothetical protein